MIYDIYFFPYTLHYKHTHTHIYDLFVEFVFCLLFSIIINTLLWHSLDMAYTLIIIFRRLFWLYDDDDTAMMLMGVVYWCFMYIFSKFWTIDAYYFSHYMVYFVQTKILYNLTLNHTYMMNVWIFSIQYYYYCYCMARIRWSIHVLVA